MGTKASGNKQTFSVITVFDQVWVSYDLADNWNGNSKGEMNVHYSN